MSLSTIATNVRVARGGSFAIISRALGLEAGGAIGVPLYIAQSISSVMYLYAFSEGWAVLFPDHNGMLVAAGGFAVVATVALASASLAARAQAIMLGVVAIAMISALAGLPGSDLANPVMVGRFQEVGPLGTFAIFFPAATGIMVGAGMSGELSNPRTALPRGTLLAWGTTLLAYVVFAFWYALIADPETLMAQKTVMVERAAIGQLVLAGLLSSTLMAALSSMVAAPRLLHAMAEYDIVPRSEWLKRTTPSGEPRNAIFVTLGLASLGLLSGSLDAIAPVITSCFLLTYLAVNAVVFLEQQLAMVSFRPAWPIPRWIPAVGMLACVIALGLSSPGGGLFEVIGVVGLYAWLTSRRLDTPWETVHSGLAMTLAARLALWAATLEQSARSWKPDLLVPVMDTKGLAAVAPLVRNIIAIQGSVKYTAMVDDPVVKKALDNEVRRLRDHGRFSSWHPMAAEEPTIGIRLTMNVMRGTFFASNLLLVTDDFPTASLQDLRDHGVRTRMGMGLLIPGPAGPPDGGRRINVWLSDRAPDWQIGLKVANTDLPVLLGMLLASPQQGRIRLHTAVRDADEADNALAFLNALIDQGRLPASTTAAVSTQPFMKALQTAGSADLHLLGLPQDIDLARLREIRDAVDGPCLFLRDSGQESLLA